MVTSKSDLRIVKSEKCPPDPDQDFYRNTMALATSMTELAEGKPGNVVIMASIDVAVRVYRLHGCGESEALLELLKEVEELISASKGH